MNPGEVWILHCIGIKIYGLVLKLDSDGSFRFLDLEEGVVRRWHSPARIGFQVGKWERFT